MVHLYNGHLLFTALPSSYPSSSLGGRGRTLKGAEREDLLEAPSTEGATRLAAPPAPVNVPVPAPIPPAVPVPPPPDPVSPVAVL